MDGKGYLELFVKILNGEEFDIDEFVAPSEASLSIQLLSNIAVLLYQLVHNGGGGGGDVSNLTLANFKNGVVVSNIRVSSQATNNNIATELSIRNAIDNAILGTFKIQGNKDTEAEILALTGSEDYEAWICLEDGKLYYWLTNQWLSVQLVDINSFINNTNGIMVVSIMPSPTVNNKDYTYFYIGETAGDFKTKTFYKCVEILPSTAPKTYHYEEYVVASDVFIDTDDLSTITNPSKQVIYRLDEKTYTHNGIVVENPIFYSALGSTVISNTGVSVNGEAEVEYGSIDATTIADWITNGYIEESSFADGGFGDYGGQYDVISNFTENNNYELYYNPTETAGVANFIKVGVSNYDELEDKPRIDNTTLTINTTRQDIKLIGEADLIKDSDFIAPKPNGIDIVLNTGTSYNPDIINDDPAYKYAENKTSSNNYINTRLETIERKADAKTLTKFVNALPANPDINTEYYVETATPDVYDRYFVDSIGTVKEIGNTTMDVSTLATKTELNLKEDLSNKTTTLDDNSTNIQYPSAKSVVDYVKDNSGNTEIVETILWQSPNGIGGSAFTLNYDINLTENLDNYSTIEVFYRDDNGGYPLLSNFFINKSDWQLLGTSMSICFFGSTSYNGKGSYVVVYHKATNTLTIRSANGELKFINIKGYKSIPMLNTYSREIRELIMNTPVGGTATGQSKTITLTKGMSNYDYLDFYYKTATSNDNAYDMKRVAVKDFINYFNSTTVNCSLEIFDLYDQRRWCKFYRTADTTFAATITNMYIQKIEGIKAEPVVQGSPAYKQLYYNANGVSSGNITLNDDLSKFSYIEMIARSSNTATPAVGSSKLGTNYFINKNSLIIVNQQWEGNSTLFTYIKYVNNTTVSVTNSGGGAVIEVIGWY